MKKVALIACCLLLCLWAATANAVNSVVVESRTYAADAAPCSVGVFITNDINIQGIVVPLEIRSFNGGAEIDSGTSTTSFWGLVNANRMNNSALGNANPNGPAASVTTRKYAVPEAAGANCTGGGDYGWGAAGAQFDGHSPDAMLFASVSTGDPDIGEDIFLAPGADGAGTPNASLLIRFNLKATNGCIIIDTMCTKPASHLTFVDEFTSAVQPDFTPGFITVGTGSCVQVPNVPPNAVCQNIQVAANGLCQGDATADLVDNGSTDSDGTIQSMVLHPGPPYALGANPVWLVVTDDDGDVDSCSATITVVDDTDPAITCPGDIAVQCSANIPAAYADAAAFLTAGGTFADNCAGAGWTFSYAGQTSDGQSCPEVITRLYVLTDDAGNADTCAQLITVDDTEAPVITACPNDTTIHLPNGTTSTAVLYSDADITDNCNNVNIIHSPLSNSTFNVGTTQVRLIASDLCGNADTCFFNVTIIEDPPGNTPPTAVCQNVVVDADGNCQGSATAAQVNNGSNDNEDGTNLILALEPAGPYALGANPVKLIVTDQGGLADTCDATVTVEDNTAPVVVCPDTVTVGCFDDVPAHLADVAAFLTAGGTITDNCPGPFNLNWSGQQPTADECTGYFKYFYILSDAAGNEQGCEQVFAIRDAIAPVVTCPNDTLVQVPFGTPSVNVSYSAASASDNCDPSVDISYNPPLGTSFTVPGNYDIEVIATDNCGNADTCHFSVTVEELPDVKVPPVALCTDRIVDADTNCEANADINNGSNDPDGGSVTTSQAPPGPYSLGSTLVLLTVTDDEGDEDTCSAFVTVVDNTPPTVTCGPINVDNDPGFCSGQICVEDINPVVGGDDNCGLNLITVVIYTPVKAVFSTKGVECYDIPVGIWDMSVVAYDNAGNASDTCWTTVTVSDTEHPVAFCPDDFTIPNDPAQCGAIFDFLANGVGSTDNCEVASSVYSPPAGSFFPVGTTQVRHIVADNAGNKDTCFFNVTVEDTEVPVITCSDNITINAAFGQTGAVVNWTTGATDNCPGVTYDCDSSSGAFFLVGGPYTVCCRAYDAAQNFDSCCFTITVLPPSQEVPGPHVTDETDTLTFKVTCGCDTQQVDIFCISPNKGEECFYQAETAVPGISVSPNPGNGPALVDVIACATGVAATVEGWVYLHNAPGAISDSFYVIFETNQDTPGVVLDTDTLSFTYTGDIWNDKLCLPVNIAKLGCEETCWSLVGETGWVWVDPTSGTTPGEIEICVDPCTLAVGTYYQTVTFCPCEKGADVISGCDQLVVKLVVEAQPIMVVEPKNLLFEIFCDQKANPLPVYVSNADGGVLEWVATWDANWFNVEPSDGTADDTFYVSLNPDSIKCPEVCDTIIDSICVTGNKLCAIDAQQWVRVELRICPRDTVECDSICGWVYNSDCFEQKSLCGLDDATVELWTSYPDGVLITSTTTDWGKFCFAVTPGEKYEIRAWKKGYCTDVVGPWSCEDGELIIHLDPINFVPLPNWPYFTDYYSSDATSEGFPIQPGDVIYATDPDGVICGITYVELDSAGTYLIHVLGDDIKTPEDEGALPGDSITLWLNCECPVVAPDTWLNFASYRFDAAWDCRPTGLCCTLCEGWNMWSYNIQLPDYAREAVLATIDLNYDAVRSGLCDYGSISWFANRPINDLVDVSPWFGYDIHMLQEDTICIEGEVIDPSTPIYLCEGWNYIPYLPMEMDNLGHALESLDGNYAHIFTLICGYGVASWNELREPQNNDLVCMESCHGYWIKMKSEDTLIYPAEAEGCLAGTAKLVANSTSGRVTATPMVADYYANSSNLNAGSTISVRNSSGTLIGEGTVGANGAFLVHVYGDVPQTSEIEGAVYGEELSFQVNGVAASAGNDVRWIDRDNQAIALTVDEASAVPTEYSLLQNYPNPFNAGTVMPFVIKNASQWTLTVYNIMGQTVQTFEGFDAAGTVRVAWNGQDQNGSTVPSGVYFYRVTTPEWSATKKMTLLK